MSATVCVVGGYGEVGRQVCHLLAVRHPDLRILVAGHDPDRAQQVAATLPDSAAVAVEVRDADPLAGVTEPVDAVVVLSGDPGLRLLGSALARGAAVVDASEQVLAVDAVADLVAAAATADPAGSGTVPPVVLPVGWAASAAAVAVAGLLADGTAAEPYDSVEVSALLRHDDRVGPAAAAAWVDLHRSFVVWEEKRRRLARGFAEPRRTAFDAGTFRARRVSSGEQDTLVEAGIAQGVAVRLAYDHAPSALGLAALVGTGAWAFLPRSVRARLLTVDAESGTPHEVRVLARRGEAVRHLVLRDPAGRAHLAAASTVSQVERVLGLGGRVVPPGGLSYPEQAPDAAKDVEAMRQMGVEVVEE
ncbi:MAG: saccharopine dehydrogenase NADP-binding domain-containing protein [Nocardioides sp.]|uniref:saccharopine dehydrogenase NADP-binding domain-containing protein n=1 Tax=Nocardioides sp. TaxID=35761 RepID=UPI003EFC0918